jgi:hypothetical protein
MATVDTTPPSIALPPGFAIGSVDGKNSPHPHLVPSIIPTPPDQAPLGVLSNFVGVFAGSGFNLIFRPNGAPVTPVQFPIPVTSPKPPPAVPNENVLQLNLTTETLTFSAALGAVPNRGLGLDNQGDITLNGVPYAQVIADVTDIETGAADPNPNNAVGIHFEPGLWMHVPATTVDPVAPESLVRMASIPHGTTINAQGLAAGTTISGPPNFTDSTKPNQVPVADPTPFVINKPTPKLVNVFAALTLTSPATPRIPQDLTKFDAAGTITQAILDNVNTVLGNAIVNQNITSTVFFSVSTNPLALPTTEVSGGTDNVAFLQGTGATSTAQPNANASAAQMDATFWVETVESEIVVPSFTPGQAPLLIKPDAPNPVANVPTFSVTPPGEITQPTTIPVSWTQIQYSQTVLLNFAGLTWPHISVATLVPSDPLTVPVTAFPTTS